MWVDTALTAPSSCHLCVNKKDFDSTRSRQNGLRRKKTRSITASVACTAAEGTMQNANMNKRPKRDKTVIAKTKQKRKRNKTNSQKQKAFHHCEATSGRRDSDLNADSVAYVWKEQGRIHSYPSRALVGRGSDKGSLGI